MYVPVLIVPLGIAKGIAVDATGTYVLTNSILVKFVAAANNNDNDDDKALLLPPPPPPPSTKKSKVSHKSSKSTSSSSPTAAPTEASEDDAPTGTPTIVWSYTYDRGPAMYNCTAPGCGAEFGKPVRMYFRSFRTTESSTVAV